jgi:hypothetical protein
LAKKETRKLSNYCVAFGYGSEGAPARAADARGPKTSDASLWAAQVYVCEKGIKVLLFCHGRSVRFGQLVLQHARGKCLKFDLHRRALMKQRIFNTGYSKGFDAKV